MFCVERRSLVGLLPIGIAVADERKAMPAGQPYHQVKAANTVA
jgi:hypothetical protein